MKKISKSRFPYSEEEMGDAFRKMLQSSNGLLSHKKIIGVYRDIDCRQGRPDFIVLANGGKVFNFPFKQHVGLVGASILSILKPSAWRTFEYINRRSEYSMPSVKKTLSSLISSGYVDRTETGSYVLSKQTKNFEVEVWAFELKLDNPKRAIFQAKQCKAFAERVVVVAPPSQIKNYYRFDESFKRWGIGLASFDPINNEFNISKHTRKGKPFSRQDKIYALSQIFAGVSSMAQKQFK